MIRIILMILFTALLEPGYTQAVLTLHNRSSVAIDSIVIEGTRSVNKGSMGKGGQKTFLVDFDNANFHAIAPFYVKVFSAALNTSLQWNKGQGNHLYFFNHSLGQDDQEAPHPREFGISVLNAGTEKIDTTFAPHPAVTKIIEQTPRVFGMTIDRQKFEEQPAVSLKVGNKVLKADLGALNLNDWNRNGASLYIEHDTIFTGIRRGTPFEFVIYFEVQDGMSLNDIRIKAPHLLKTYIDNGAHTIRAVFDYARFKADARFQVQAGSKTFSSQLKTYEMEGDFQIFTISKDQVRRL